MHVSRWAGLGVSIPAASRRSKRCAPYSIGERGSTLTASSTPPASPTGLAAEQLLAPWGRVPGSAASAPVMRRPVTAAQAIAAFSHPGRCRNDAAFASRAGTCPIPAKRTHRGPPPQPRRRPRPSAAPSTPSPRAECATAPPPRPTSPVAPPKANHPREQTLPQAIHHAPAQPHPHRHHHTHHQQPGCRLTHIQASTSTRRPLETAGEAPLPHSGTRQAWTITGEGTGRLL